ncbi:hypothetical protein [Fluviicola sp.]|uniref:hypothetical protein n=1 Tax=Fluviicola sp. TaxID=1917219 RepID=UPI0031E3A6A3
MQQLLFILFLLITPLISVAQGVISLPEYNVLYRAYPNRVVLGAGSKTSEFTLESTDAAIVREGDSVFIVRITGTNRTVDLNIRNTKSNEIVQVWRYRVMNLPVPVLYWGQYPEGSKVTPDQGEWNLAYEENVIFGEADFEIVSYELWIDGTSYVWKCKGNLIVPDFVESLKATKVLNNGQEIHFSVAVQYRSNDGVQRLKRATFSY